MELDPVDLQLLYLLERNSRSTLTEMADVLSISPNTVSNRLERLEEEGIINGYTVDIDYRKAGLSFFWMFHCTVSIASREELAEQAMSISGVTDAYEMMTGERNLLVKGVGRYQDDITRIARELNELGIRVVDGTSIRRNWHSTVAYFDSDSGEEQ